MVMVVVDVTCHVLGWSKCLQELHVRYTLTSYTYIQILPERAGSTILQTSFRAYYHNYHHDSKPL